jgi:hypothetical protein
LLSGETGERLVRGDAFLEAAHGVEKAGLAIFSKAGLACFGSQRPVAGVRYWNVRGITSTMT